MESSTRAEVLAVLRRHGDDMTIAGIAGELGVHPNTARFHVDTLLARGQVEQLPTAPSGPGRPAARFQAVAGMDPQGPRHYRMLAEALTLALADAPRPAENAQRAGRDWGSRLMESQAADTDAVTTLTTILDDLGFAPQRLDPATIGLRHCPFLELATSAPQVVCSIHLGLMRGALDSLGSRAEVTDLEPFVRPDLCVARVDSREAAS